MKKRSFRASSFRWESITVKATSIAIVFFALGICGQAAAKEPTRVMKVSPTIKNMQVQKKPILLGTPCPPGWKLASGSAQGAYSCTRNATPSCATGYHVDKSGSCKTQGAPGSLNLSQPLACAYQCTPNKPTFKPKCKGMTYPMVGPCKVGCQEPIR